MATTQTTRQLTVNIVTSATWTQMRNLADDAAYTTPTDGRTQLRWIKAMNFGANSAQVEFAISPDNTPTDAQRMMTPVTLETGDTLYDSSGHSIPVGFGVWCRATGATPNVSFAGEILEIVTT